MAALLARDVAGDPDALLSDLDAAQREAVLAASGPVAILAGAGTGKTRVISRRTAYAIRTGLVAADQALVVTFTDKAAGEMVGRLRDLGLPGVTARTFHAHALSQLRHFWPSRHDGRPLPGILDSKLALLAPLARRLPGHYRFTPVKDLADEIEWAKSRRIAPSTYATQAGVREPPIPLDLFVRVFEGYERAKASADRIDFDDLLALTVELLETDADAADTVRARKSWFSVDEYQDTNPLQERLLELWLGDRRDLCVVGDEDQTIYTFTGATSAFLTGFAELHPGARVIALTHNYRSSRQVLDLANRLMAADGREKRLVATAPDGPEPAIARHPTAAAELDALVAAVRRLLADGIAPAAIAVLVRMNAQLAPIEEEFTRAGIAYRLRGARFYDQAEVRAAIELVRRAGIEVSGAAARAAVVELWRRRLGYGENDASAVAGPEAREREAALETLLAILDDLLRTQPAMGAADWLAELGRRAAHERANAGDGVELLTLHRAKGLEWDAVFLPMLEEGSLPIRQALDDDQMLAEERRLLYVGITRARVHLALSWAEGRESRGRETTRRPSRFLAALQPARSDGRPARGSAASRTPGPRRFVELPDAFAAPGPAADDGTERRFAVLREWRAARAREDGVPAYVIAHDATLRAIAEAFPRSLPALRRVKGMGPTRLERYGPEVLAALGDA